MPHNFTYFGGPLYRFFIKQYFHNTHFHLINHQYTMLEVHGHNFRNCESISGWFINQPMGLEPKYPPTGNRMFIVSIYMNKRRVANKLLVEILIYLGVFGTSLWRHDDFLIIFFCKESIVNPSCTMAKTLIFWNILLFLLVLALCNLHSRSKHFLGHKEIQPDHVVINFQKNGFVDIWLIHH